MSTTNWWGDWRPNLPAHTGDLQPTDLIECTSIIGGVPVNTAITGQQIINAASGGSSSLTVGTTAIASGTIGRVLFQGTGNVLQQSANLFWDNTNGRLGIGGTPGAFNLDVNGTARVNGDLSVTTGAFKSIISSVTSQFTSYNPSNNYPRAQFQVGQNASDVNVGLTIAPLFSSTGVQKPTFIQVSTNKNTIDTGQFSAYFSVSTSLFTIGTNKQDGQVAGGVPIVFSPANTEALRINNNGNIGVNTTTNAGYRLDVNGTARVQGKLSVNTPTAASAVMEVTSTTQGFLPPRMTNAQMLAIATPAAGLVVYDTTNNKHCGYNGTAWQNFY